MNSLEDWIDVKKDLEGFLDKRGSPGVKDMAEMFSFMFYFYLLTAFLGT